MREKTVEQALIEAAKQEGGRAYKWVSPGEAGIPDRLVFLPLAGGPCVHCGTTVRVGALELKRPRETPEPLQVRQREDLQATGLPVGWADTPGMVKAWVQKLVRGLA